MMLAFLPAKENGEGAVTQSVNGSGPAELPVHTQWAREEKTHRSTLPAKRKKRRPSEPPRTLVSVTHAIWVIVEQEIKTHTRDRISAKRKIDIGARAS
jgi:hypothetical protein